MVKFTCYQLGVYVIFMDDLSSFAPDPSKEKEKEALFSLDVLKKMKIIVSTYIVQFHEACIYWH